MILKAFDKSWQQLTQDKYWQENKKDKNWQINDCLFEIKKNQCKSILKREKQHKSWWCFRFYRIKMEVVKDFIFHCVLWLDSMMACSGCALVNWVQVCALCPPEPLWLGPVFDPELNVTRPKALSPLAGHSTVLIGYRTLHTLISIHSEIKPGQVSRAFMLNKREIKNNWFTVLQLWTLWAFVKPSPWGSQKPVPTKTVLATEDN